MGPGSMWAGVGEWGVWGAVSPTLVKREWQLVQWAKSDASKAGYPLLYFLGPVTSLSGL